MAEGVKTAAQQHQLSQEAIEWVRSPDDMNLLVRGLAAFFHQQKLSEQKQSSKGSRMAATWDEDASETWEQEAST
eukprot:2345842-Amphidinium_carterae.1